MPPVLRICPVSLNVVTTPPTVTWISGTKPVGEHVMGVSEVSKLSPAVPVRIRICPGGMTTFRGQMS